MSTLIQEIAEQVRGALGGVHWHVRHYEMGGSSASATVSAGSRGSPPSATASCWSAPMA